MGGLAYLGLGPVGLIGASLIWGVSWSRKLEAEEY
jgi:hypothetical protein